MNKFLCRPYYTTLLTVLPYHQWHQYKYSNSVAATLPVHFTTLLWAQIWHIHKNHKSTATEMWLSTKKICWLPRTTFFAHTKTFSMSVYSFIMLSLTLNHNVVAKRQLFTETLIYLRQSCILISSWRFLCFFLLDLSSHLTPCHPSYWHCQDYFSTWFEWLSQSELHHPSAYNVVG